MKQLLLIFLFISSTIVVFSQTPDSPELCLVTVGNDSLVHLEWNYSDTTTIDGFIIKRIIYDGNGVVDGTLNTIEIIPNILLSFVDTSNSYSTFSKPYKRNEEYSINAFLIRNDSTILSNISLTQNSIFLNTSWDKCLQKAQFIWNRYKNRAVQKYRLLFSLDKVNYNLLAEFSANDSTYTLVTLNKNTQYYFKIQAIISSQGSCNQDTSISNTTNFYTYSPIAPDELKSISASVNENNSIDLKFYNSTGFGIQKIRIKKNQDEIIADFNNDLSDIIYTDLTDTKIKNCYLVQAIDSCGNILKESAEVCNMVLNVQQNNNVFDISFSSTTINENTPDYYTLMIDVGDGWIDFKQVVSGINSIPLSEIFTSLKYNELSEIGFKIYATKTGQQVFSNTIFLPLDAFIAVPNAFNPTSNNEEDRFFTVKGMFIQEFDLIIFTENNEMVFHSTNINESWNGLLNNSYYAPQGAYIYKIKYKANSGIWHTKNGVVNLIY